MDSSTSPEQIDANRPGPITEEGKARASQNARVHGLCSRQLHLAASWNPHFETITHARWNLRRYRMNEAKLLASVPDPFLDPAVGAALKTLTIYTSRHERVLHRAQQELKARQTERAIRTNLAGAAGDDAEPSLPTSQSTPIDTSKKGFHTECNDFLQLERPDVPEYTNFRRLLLPDNRRRVGRR